MSIPIPQSLERIEEIEDLAARVLVAAYGVPVEVDDDRDPAQWVKDIVASAFIIAEAFFAEIDRRRA